VENLKAQILAKSSALTTSNNATTKLQKENENLKALQESMTKELEELRKLKDKVAD
jgi:prefoldin subunit 5